MRYSKQILNEIRSKTLLSEVVSTKVDLEIQGSNHVGCCPFHDDKTPSFNVYDAKGTYRCFGCGKNGSAFDYVMLVNDLTFPEAVRFLANHAGVSLPSQVKLKQKDSSAKAALAEAADWYQEQFRMPIASNCRAYITQRGFTEKVLVQYRIGYAPNRGLTDKLLSDGFSIATLVEAGLSIEPDSGGKPFDRFRNRLMFPIMNGQGVIIAFGGRALDSNAKAKYLNSPETPLFRKRETLYGLHVKPSKEAIACPTIAVEGYLDVIKLFQHGFNAPVAPLGTALTEKQIQLLWERDLEPVLAFDGDRAGKQAALNAMDRILPMLQPGKSFRFLRLPEGEDPDTLLTRSGEDAFLNCLDNSLALIDMLWDCVLEGCNLTTPERRAGFEKALFDRVKSIKHRTVRKEYQQQYSTRLKQLFAGVLLSKDSQTEKASKTNTVADIERGVALCLLHQPSLTAVRSLANIVFVDPLSRSLYNVLKKLGEEDNKFSRNSLLLRLQGAGSMEDALSLLLDPQMDELKGYVSIAGPDAVKQEIELMVERRNLLLSAKQHYSTAEKQLAG